MGGRDANELHRDDGIDPEALEPMETPAMESDDGAAESILGGAPTRDAIHGAEALERDMQREVFPIRALPAWPGGVPPSPDGHGWGEALDYMLGGLVPGRVILLGAAGAKAGKTAFLMQLADGLALHSAAVDAGVRSGALTPALILSEMDARALNQRTLGRWFGCQPRCFASAPNVALLNARAAQMSAEMQASELERIRSLQRSAIEAFRPDGKLAAMCKWQRVPTQIGTGPEAIRTAALMLRAWREQLERDYPGHAVLPVLVIDPVQRFAGAADGEVEGQNAIAKALRSEADNGGLVILATSDTNKAAGMGDRDRDRRDEAQDAAAIFRGSYGLLHALDAALVMEKEKVEKGCPPEPWKPVRVNVTVGLNRWGPAGWPPASFEWERETGRFRSIPHTQTGPEKGDASGEAPKPKGRGGRKGRSKR
jgi:hypothetical protein